MNSRSILGFRMISADPVRLSGFYRAIGFDVGERVHIAAAEIERLGLQCGGSRTAMRLGPSRVDLDAFTCLGRPYPREASACDLVFQHLALVTHDARAAWRRARDAGALPISREEAVTLPPSAGGVTAIKFRDPEGHPLEFLQFPPSANPRWTGTGIMGIDHSAISVSDVAASQRFYTGLGAGKAHATVNEGIAQDLLDGLDGVTVDVVALQSQQASPHVELLGYRTPSGRPHPPLAPNDIAATRIVWQSDSDALLYDPDGHLQQLIG
jgi:catechol 2,3-dioxygenase-like lactoylglutathione lyase family enzyme